ncbi:phosphatidylserine/phosphatidylglycerophosphate/cardiolipin synthase family protein [Motiliproteus coralliicola]|uniref:Phosphatidylserine/phosphatidylglycerophosphate/ cardiolipin synthase family protein n=1 Tax=Motiliproteus coralliicola TaxID=2283196 RepID=A0A369WW36_9GAMM|nr:phosphatidylserine/phosphatidylglycerophosphate/cardiolipin synthase family protein [Motiliproteus coralliicola]RDE25249.1 phosphatidylserine/phosphatidylglycerophosphate/cardiolipin synthase family protein [Motiliproteus coralliicola]
MKGSLVRQLNQTGLYRRQPWPWRDGNHSRLLVGGARYFPAMVESIDQAQERILLEFYLVSSGRVMDELIDSLVRARQRGLRVWFLLDDFGSRGLVASDRQRLRDAGVELAFYNRLRVDKWNRNFARDHRKLLAVDGRVAFVGGTGLCDEFLPAPQGAGWHELMLRIEGPVVTDWEQLFARVWRWCRAQQLTFTPFRFSNAGYGLADAGRDGSSVHSASSEFIAERGGLMKVSTCEGPQQQEIKINFRRRINESEQRLWLVTAYFLPSWSIRRALRRAARRGVDVRLLLPGDLSDHPGIFYASRRYYQRLLRAGVKIYEYRASFNHSKVCLSDDWVSIGSCNLDHWNLRWNLEANQEVIDPQLCRQLQQQLRRDFEFSHQISLRSWLARPLWRRLYEFVLGYLAAILLRIF